MELAHGGRGPSSSDRRGYGGGGGNGGAGGGRFGISLGIYVNRNLLAIWLSQFHMYVCL